MRKHLLSVVFVAVAVASFLLCSPALASSFVPQNGFYEATVTELSTPATDCQGIGYVESCRLTIQPDGSILRETILITDEGESIVADVTVFTLNGKTFKDLAEAQEIDLTPYGLEAVINVTPEHGTGVFTSDTSFKEIVGARSMDCEGADCPIAATWFFGEGGKFPCQMPAHKIVAVRTGE